MIDEKSLDKNESIEFIFCLEIEKYRHTISIDDCLIKMQSSFSFLLMTFWFSSYKRHIQDIEMIDKSIKYLKLKWNLI